MTVNSPQGVTRARILALLEARAPHWVGGYELRDTASPHAEVGNIRVHIWKLRKAGHAIESRNGPYGGYRIGTPE